MMNDGINDRKIGNLPAQRGFVPSYLWDRLVHAYNKRDDVAFDAALDEVESIQSRVLAAIDAEPELPGEITRAVRLKIEAVGLEQALRLLVVLTKESIAARVAKEFS